MVITDLTRHVFTIERESSAEPVRHYRKSTIEFWEYSQSLQLINGPIIANCLEDAEKKDERLLGVLKVVDLSQEATNNNTYTTSVSTNVSPTNKRSFTPPGGVRSMALPPKQETADRRLIDLQRHRSHLHIGPSFNTSGMRTACREDSTPRLSDLRSRSPGSSRQVSATGLDGNHPRDHSTEKLWCESK